MKSLHKLGLFFLLAFSIFPLFSKGQGCSDAGFCTMGAMKPDQKFNKNLDLKLRSLEISQYIARTKFNDAIMASTLDFNFGLGKKNTVQFKIPYMVILNKLSNTQGVGDISVSFSRNLIFTEKYQINATIGAKIPTNHSDIRSKEGLPLPMYHQTSLGTYDLVLGASFMSRGWLIAAGYQQPLTSQNDNQFVWVAWAGNDKFDNVLAFPQSRLLKRNADVMVRVEKNFRFSKFNFHVGLLNIHRFQEDEITNADDEKVRIAGSSGSALSLIIGSTYHFNTKSALKFIFGDRWLERQKNPDGLSREQVYTLAYQINF